MGDMTENYLEKQKGQSFTEREFALLQELVRSRMERNEKLEYESFEGYELPPRTQFSMLKKPAVSIKYGKMTFNMASIRLFKEVKHVLTIVNMEKKKLAVVPCAEEESASVEWARQDRQGKWVNKEITSVDFLENIFRMMGWNRECRYKVLGRVAASDKGLILVFEMSEAIMFAAKKESYIDPVTGEEKKRQVKYYPDAYKNRIGRSYAEYNEYRQMNLFEDIGTYEEEKQTLAVPEPESAPAPEQGTVSGDRNTIVHTENPRVSEEGTQRSIFDMEKDVTVKQNADLEGVGEYEGNRQSAAYAVTTGEMERD